jgi:hypothetical protein
MREAPSQAPRAVEPLAFALAEPLQSPLLPDDSAARGGCYRLMVRWVFCGALGSALVLACSSGGDRPPPLYLGGAPGPSSTSTDPPLIDIPMSGGLPTIDPSCGDEVTPVLLEAPSVYLVVDRSGSMLEPIDATGLSKYRAARLAVLEMLRQIGHRVKYGGAIFPAFAGAACDAGTELLGVELGDPYSYRLAGTDGPRFKEMARRLDLAAPPFDGSGGTPTAATLVALTPTLAALEGKRAVVLLTDGAPNCNREARCDVGSCLPNLFYGPNACSEGVSCCDVDAFGAQVASACLDSEPSVEAVRGLAQMGVSTFVLGMPGTEVFADVLNRMAVAGGTARAEGPQYYSVEDTQALSEALSAIGAEVAQGCEIELALAPRDAEQVNVYLDTALLPKDSAEGWEWKSPKLLELQGEACQRVRSGDVQFVQVVAGCPTVVR